MAESLSTILGFELPGDRIQETFIRKENEYFTKLNEMKELEIVEKDLYKNKFNKCYKISCGVPEFISEEKYNKVTGGDESLVNCINELLDWYFNPKINGHGGFIISSEPGVGKTKLMIALTNLQYYFPYPRYATKGPINYVSFNAEINKFKRGSQDFDPTFYFDQNLILDDVTDELKHINHYKNQYSLDAFFKERYELWQSKGYFTIITTNLVPNLDGEFDDIVKSTNCGDLKSMIEDKTLTRVKHQFKEIILTGSSKRGL